MQFVMPRRVFVAAMQSSFNVFSTAQLRRIGLQNQY
jgi:hypothetical protein